MMTISSQLQVRLQSTLETLTIRHHLSVLLFSSQATVRVCVSIHPALPSFADCADNQSQSHSTSLKTPHFKVYLSRFRQTYCQLLSDFSNNFFFAGVSAGLDMTLYFIAKEMGQEEAEKTAKFAEYNGQWTDPLDDPWS